MHTMGVCRINDERHSYFIVMTIGKILVYNYTDSFAAVQLPTQPIDEYLFVFSNRAAKTIHSLRDNDNIIYISIRKSWSIIRSDQD